MSKSGCIILVEDDPDDQELMTKAIQNMGRPNTIRVFGDGEEALHYLRTMEEQPFIIVSDVNMPRMNGIAFKAAIDKDPVLKSKSIPFVFFSTAANKDQVKKAYELTVQGFFVKGNDYATMKDTLKMILSYWDKASHPNS